MSAGGDLQWDRRKRMLAWVHHGIQLAALLAVLVMLNLLTQKFPARWDLTSRRGYALSPMGEDMLKTLPYDVDIWFNGERMGTGDDKALPNAMNLTAEMLKEFMRRTTHVRVHDFVGANTPKLDVFQKHWSAVPPATLFILADLGGGRVNKKQIDIQDLYQGDALSGEVQVFKGEPILVQTIQELGGAVKRIVYESEGHHEILTADVRRLGLLGNFLKLNEGIEVRRLPLNEYKTIPIDCELLMIMAPEQPFLENELEVIRDYLERGGSLLVAVVPKVRTGLEALLLEYSIKVGENLVFDPQQFTPPSQMNLVVVDFNMHPINRNMSNVQFQIPRCCTIDPVDRKDNNWTITPLAMAGPGSWEEKGDTSPSARPKPDADERVGNMKLVVAVEKTAKHPMDEKHKTAKIVVWGSVLPFTNDVLKSAYSFQLAQGQYVVNNYRWLMERQLLKIEPKRMSVKPLVMSGDALSQLRGVILFGFPAFGISLGVLAWFLRRK